MATQADLRRLILTHLTIIDAEGDVEADQGSLLDLFINGASDELKEKGLLWWDADAIPGAVTIPLSRYVSALACKAFGKGNKGYEADKDQARKDIAALKSSEERPEQRAEYY